MKIKVPVANDFAENEVGSESFNRTRDVRTNIPCGCLFSFLFFDLL